MADDEEMGDPETDLIEAIGKRIAETQIAPDPSVEIP